jgi:hypothetical protein
VRCRGALVEVEGAGPVLAHVGHALVTHGIEPGDLRVHQPTLEDVYLRLTGPESQERGAVRTLAETTWVELKLFAREPLTVIFTLALPVIVLYTSAACSGTPPTRRARCTGGSAP